MTYIYLFIQKGRAAAYGIGTYIKQLIYCLEGVQDISVNCVEFGGENEFKVTEHTNYRIYSFPYLVLPDNNAEKVCRNAWYILKSYIQSDKDDQIIFHFNFPQERFFYKYIQRDMPNNLIYYTIHYQDWCFMIYGNLSYYESIIREGENQSDLLKKEIFRHYKEEKEALKKVDKIICLSRFTQELLIKHYDITVDNTKLIYNGLKNDFKILSKKEKIKIKKKMSFLIDEKIILFVGRLDSIKGLDILIEAFKKTVNKYPSCRLVIAGEGFFSRYIEQTKGYWSKISFVGKLGKTDLYALYQVADIGVLPSLHEQCSYVGIEMMGFALPLVGTTSTGLKEMIQYYNKGIALEATEEEKNVVISPDKLSRILLQLLKYDTISSESFPEIFSIHSMQRNYLKLYRKK